MLPPNDVSPAKAGSSWSNLPAVLWVGVGALGIITVLTLFRALATGSVGAFVAVLCNVALLVGLVLGHR